MTAQFNSNIDTGLPNTPLVNDPVLREQLQLVYSAIQIIQIALSDLDARITALEAYNTSHP